MWIKLPDGQHFAFWIRFNYKLYKLFGFETETETVYFVRQIHDPVILK